MNNIKKIGLTALAGSLVTLGSAVAGEMSVSGGINTTLKFGKGGGNTSKINWCRQRRSILRWW